MYHWTQSRSRIRHIRTRPTKAYCLSLGYGTHRHAHTLHIYYYTYCEPYGLSTKTFLNSF